MEVVVDLHAHSVFAGGTQGLSTRPENLDANRKKAVSHLTKTNLTMPLKGVDLVGTGDCQFTLWTDILKDVLVEDVNGVFFLQNNNQTRFILQTEMIFTAKIGKYSKETHVIFLFPDFSCIETFRELLDKWKVKHQKMARPFITCQASVQVADFSPAQFFLPSQNAASVLLTTQKIYCPCRLYPLFGRLWIFFLSLLPESL